MIGFRTAGGRTARCEDFHNTVGFASSRAYNIARIAIIDLAVYQRNINPEINQRNINPEINQRTLNLEVKSGNAT